MRKGASIQETFTITVGSTNLITPAVSLSGTSSVAASARQATVAGTLATTAQAGSVAPSQNSYTLVSATDRRRRQYRLPDRRQSTGDYRSRSRRARTRSRSAVPARS